MGHCSRCFSYLEVVFVPKAESEKWFNPPSHQHLIYDLIKLWQKRKSTTINRHQTADFVCSLHEIFCYYESLMQVSEQILKSVLHFDPNLG